MRSLAETGLAWVASSRTRAEDSPSAVSLDLARRAGVFFFGFTASDYHKFSRKARGGRPRARLARPNANLLVVSQKDWLRRGVIDHPRFEADSSRRILGRLASL